MLFFLFDKITVPCPWQLHVCVVCDGSWRWTKPFSIGEAGIQAIDIPIGRYMATLLIKINLIGGLQKQVHKHVQ